MSSRKGSRTRRRSAGETGLPQHYFRHAPRIVSMVDYRCLSNHGSDPRFEHHTEPLSVIPMTIRYAASKTSNSHLRFGPASRILWLRAVLAMAFLCGFLLSKKLWITSRSYPLAPVSGSLPTIHFPLDYIVFIALLILLPVIMISSRPRRYILVFVGLAALLSLWDQSRWQPWFYQYIFMLASLGLYSWNSSELKEQDAPLNCCRFIVASIYFWSGIQKMNVRFVAGMFPWLMKPLVRLLPHSVTIFPRFLGIIAPLLESGIGIGLLTNRFRGISIGLAVAMHTLILLSLGPLGHNWNSVVWPWNISMVLFVITLFWRVKHLSLGDITNVGIPPFHKLVLVLFGVMPLFSFFGLWDSYLSGTLYSANTAKANLSVSDNVRAQLPTEIQRHIWKGASGENRLGISDWSFEELNVPPYPERRIYKAIARQICGYAQKPSEVLLDVQERPDWLSGIRPVSRYDCWHLK